MRSLAIILREEFGVVFRFYDAATGSSLAGIVSQPERTSHPTTTPTAAELAVELDRASATRLASEGVARVQHLQGAQFQLALPFADLGRPTTIAVGLISGLARTPAEVVLEQARLSKWLQSVHLRLHAVNQSGGRHRHRQGSGPGAASLVGLEALMGLEDLLRLPRTIDRTPERSRQRVLQTVARVLRARTLLWVNSEDDEAMIEGEPLLSPWDCGQLARLLAEDVDGARTGYLLNNQVQASRWGGRFPQLATLLAVPVPVRTLTIWVVALNKSVSTALPASSRGSSGSGATGEPALQWPHLTPRAPVMPRSRHSSPFISEPNDATGSTRSLRSA